MVSERIQRQIDALLDEADEATKNSDWSTVLQRANAALAFDPDNGDAPGYIEAANRGLKASDSVVSPGPTTEPDTKPVGPSHPSSFVARR